MEKLFSAGARDVHYSPVFMKKNRPAYQLNVICREEQIEELEEIIFRETTTIGIRRVKMERTILKRQEEEICGWFGTAKVKVCSLPSGESRAYPEYESVKEICGKLDMAYLDVYQEIGKAWKNQHGK